MSNVKIYTNDGGKSGFVPTEGSKVFVGDTELHEVLAISMEADIQGVWQLKLTVAVDPNKVFGLLPKAE